MNANATKRPPNQIEIVKAGLSGIADSIVDAMPATMAKYLTPERIIKMTALEVGRSPALLRCTLPSILRAAVDASTLGLEIGSTIGQAYLVPFKNNKTGQMEAHLIVGYQGYIALCNRSGDLMDVDTGIVREGDVCEYQRGTTAFLRHRPDMKIDPEDQSKWIFAYCIANFTNGGQSITTMTAAEIAKVRKMSRAPAGGPWDKWTDQQWNKSVIRRGRKKWPFSVDLQIAAGLENVAESGGHIGLEFDPVIRAGVAAANKLPGAEAISLPAEAARDKTDDLLADIRDQANGIGAASVTPQSPADFEAERMAVPADAPDWEGQATGSAAPGSGRAMTPPDAPAAPEQIPSASDEPLDYDATFAEGTRLGLDKGQIQRILEDEGITVRTRSQKKFAAAVREFEQIAGLPEQPEQPKKSIHVQDATNGTSDPEPDPGSHEAVDADVLTELKRLALRHNLVHDEGDMIGLFRWICGNSAMTAPEDMTVAEATRAMDRLDIIIKRAAEKSQTVAAPEDEGGQGSLV